MKEALTHLLSDLLSAILFFAVYLVSGNIVAAAAIAIAVGLAQLAARKLAGRRVEPMQWLILGVVLVLGAATMLTQSPRFMMLKPSIGHFAVAAIMLRRGWMMRYLPEIATQNLPEPVIVAAGYAWAALLAHWRRQSGLCRLRRCRDLGLVDLVRRNRREDRRLRAAICRVPDGDPPPAGGSPGLTTPAPCFRRAPSL